MNIDIELSIEKRRVNTQSIKKILDLEIPLEIKKSIMKYISSSREIQMQNVFEIESIETEQELEQIKILHDKLDWVNEENQEHLKLRSYLLILKEQYEKRDDQSIKKNIRLRT